MTACVRRWLGVAFAAAVGLGDVAAAAAAPAPGPDLPHGVHLGRRGRYYQDKCDHDARFPCLTKRLLPETYRPDTYRAETGSGGANANSYCACGGTTVCGGGGSSPPSGAMTPSDVLAAYQIPASSAAGGKIVALVEMPDTSAFADLNVYRTAYGIPALPQCGSANNGLPDPNGGTPCFAAVDEKGQPITIVTDCAPSDAETGVDMDMVSAACPDCSIVLVQMTEADTTAGPAYADIVESVTTAIALGAAATSISFGSSEAGFPSVRQYTQPGHLVLAAAGDSGYLNETAGGAAPNYPASAPDVLGVGGTTLERSGTRYTEVVWNDGFVGGATGSGCSTESARPTFQSTFLASAPNAFGTCDMRAANDVSAAAEFVSDGVVGGIAEYDAVDGWLQTVGTSASTPLFAAIFTRLGLTDTVSADLGWVYTNSGAFNDITSGDNDVTGACTSVMCQSGPGYDGPTGVGTPNGTKLEVALAATPAPVGNPNATSGAATGATSGAATGTTSGDDSSGAAHADGPTVTTTTTCALHAGAPPPPWHALLALGGLAGLALCRRRTRIG